MSLGRIKYSCGVPSSRARLRISAQRCGLAERCPPPIASLRFSPVAAEWEAWFEWSVHEPLAREAGVDPACIDALRTHSSVMEFDNTPRLIIRVAQALCRKHRSRCALCRGTRRIRRREAGRARHTRGLLLFDLVRAARVCGRAGADTRLLRPDLVVVPRCARLRPRRDRGSCVAIAMHVDHKVLFASNARTSAAPNSAGSSTVTPSAPAHALRRPNRASEVP